jgi:hypothetical protein
MIKREPVNTQQGMRRMMGTPKNTRPAPALEPVQVTMQVPNRKTDQYDLLPAKIFNSEAEAREFARRVNGHITSIRPVMHEADNKSIPVKLYTGEELDLLVAHLAQQMGMSPAQIRQRYVEPMLAKGQIKIVSGKLVHEATVGGSGLVGLRDHYAVYKKQNGRVTKVKDTNKSGGPMNSLQAQTYVNSMIKNNPQRYNHETVWHAPADVDLDEAANPAQQAAIAINMKKHHVKPKHVSEDAIPGKLVMQGFVIEYDPATKIVTISKRGQELFRYRYNGQPSLLSFQRNVGYRINQLEDDLYGREDEPGVVSLSRIKVPGQGHGYQTLGEDATENRSAAEDSIFKRILVKHRGLIREFGRDKVVQAVESVVYNIGDLGNISEGDVGTWVHQVEQILGAE